MKLLSFSILLSGLLIATGHLITVPKNVVANVGTRVELECETNATIPVRWNFSLAGSQNSMFIYYGEHITQNLKDKYVIDNSSYRRYNLVMNAVDLSFAGTYTCSDTRVQPTTRSVGTAELIVTVTDPVCSTNATTVVMDGDYIQIICKVNYTGNWLPVTKCNKSNGRSFPMITTSISSLVTQLTSEDNGVTFTCNTTFQPMENKESTPKEVDTVNCCSVNEYQYSWNFTAQVTDVSTGRSKSTLTTLTPILQDNNDKPWSTVRLAVIAGTNTGALILCICITIIIYKICRKRNAKPDVIPEEKQISIDTSDGPHALAPPPQYSEVQNNGNGFRIAETQSFPVYASVVKERTVGDMKENSVTNNYQENQNIPVYAEVNKIEKQKTEPGPSSQIKMTTETKPKQNYSGVDGTQYMELSSLSEPKSNGAPVKNSPMFSLVETYASIDHTLSVPPPPLPPHLPRRH